MKGEGLVGQVVGKYRVERLVGRGGMGQVYSAIHPTLGTRAAIKVLHAQLAEDGMAVARFLNEARAAATLKHANTVEVYDCDRLPDGRPYMVLEYLDGEPLSRRLAREKCLSPDETVTILRSVCEGVEEAHAHGIVHRDLKPDNIFLVERKGTRPQVKVLDFGIARVRGDACVGEVHTHTGMIFGTGEYMSPEQGLGRNKLVGPRSDVYSTGIIAYQMLAGRVPFPGAEASFVELALKHAQEPPPSPRTLRPELPEPLERVVLKALEKDPARRWRSMRTFAMALSLAVDPGAEALLEGLFAGGDIDGAPAGDPAPAPEPVSVRGPVDPWATTSPAPDPLASTTPAQTPRRTGVPADDTELIARDRAAAGRRSGRWAGIVAGAAAAVVIAGMLGWHLLARPPTQPQGRPLEQQSTAHPPAVQQTDTHRPAMAAMAAAPSLATAPRPHTSPPPFASDPRTHKVQAITASGVAKPPAHRRAPSPVKKPIQFNPDGVTF